MTVAISAPSVRDKATLQSRAAAWTGASALLALVATIPLVAMLQGPVTDLVFVRGTQQNGSWTYVSALLFVLLAPATHTLFLATAAEVLKSRVPAKVHKVTVRIGAMGILPYLFMVMLGVFWQGGPQVPLLITAALTIPIAMVATIWVSTQNH